MGPQTVDKSLHPPLYHPTNARADRATLLAQSPQARGLLGVAGRRQAPRQALRRILDRATTSTTDHDDASAPSGVVSHLRQVATRLPSPHLRQPEMRKARPPA